jgi:hypothetical protein
MPRPIRIECVSCESTFRIAHDMPETHYSESYCVFCGSELEIELAMPLSDWEQEEADDAEREDWN